MTTEILEKLYTVEEFLKLELPEDEDYELIGGRIVARQGTISGKHGDIASRLSTEISNFAGYSAGDKQTGLVFVGASTNLGNPQGKNFPKLDVCFVLKDRLPDDFEGEIPVAPDLVVEINSPGDTEERKYEKLRAYQQGGVRLVWSVHLLGSYILVFRGNNPKPSLVTIDDELDGEDVLPGFRLKVSKLFG